MERERRPSTPWNGSVALSLQVRKIFKAFTFIDTILRFYNLDIVTFAVILYFISFVKDSVYVPMLTALKHGSRHSLMSCSVSTGCPSSGDRQHVIDNFYGEEYREAKTT